MWDVFISHASEDKPFARELAQALQREGLNVWYDEMTLKLGDSLRRSIDRGLAESRYGIVILSPAFFAKPWTQYELDGLVTRDIESKTILPIWHNVDRKTVARYSPALADKVAVSTDQGLSKIVSEIMEVIRPEAISITVGAPPPRDTGRRRGEEAAEPRLLYEMLVKLFNTEELRTLCFELGVDYDDLPAEGKGGKARELVAYLERRGRLEDLAVLIFKLRPNVAL